jgi:hypothetical protein
MDPASLPQSPASPNRLQIVAAGWILGLGVGIALAVSREMFENSVRTEQDVAESTPAPVLARIPLVRSPRERRRRWLWAAVEAAFALLVVAASAGTITTTYLAG